MPALSEINMLDINSWAGQNFALDAVGIFAAVWLVWLLAGYYFVLIRQDALIDKYAHLFTLVLIIGLIYATSFIVGYIWFEARPFVDGGVSLIINIPQSEKSFPSDHAAIAFALAVACWHLKPKLSPWLFGLAGLVALARVYVGVHYLHDVIAGAVLGTAVAWVSYKLFDGNLDRLRRFFSSNSK